MGNLDYPSRNYYIGTEKKPLVLTFSKINRVLKKYVDKSGILDLPTYNKCINDLTSFENFPKLAYTYLNEKCYLLLTDNNKTKLTCEKFSKALLTVLSCIDTKSIILFNAIKTDQKTDVLSFNEFFEYLKKSWKYNFKYIFNYINSNLKDEFSKNNIIIPSSVEDLYSILNFHEDDLKNYLITSLNEIGHSNIDKPLTFDIFKKWAVSDNDTQIAYGGKIFKFANSFTFMENIGVDIKAK